MKSLYILIIILIASIHCSAQTWQHLDSDLFIIRWVDTTTVFVGGTNSCVMRSTDKGATWKQLLVVGTSATIQDLAFSSSTSGCAVGGGKIFRTTDSGNHWQEIANPSGKYITSLAFNSSGTGTAFAVGGTILHSADNGASWSIVGNLGATTYAYSRLHYISNNIVIAMNKDSIIHSANSGVSFKTIRTDSSFFFQDMSVSPTGTITILGRSKKSGESAVFISSDTGQTWETTPAPEYANCIAFPEDSAGYINSTVKGIQFTHDRGVSYSQQLPPETRQLEFLNSLRFTTKNIGIAVGYKKKIYRTIDGGKSWIWVSYLGTQGDNAFGSIHFISPDTGFVGVYPTTIFRTTNGGATWLPQNTITYEHNGSNQIPSDRSFMNALYFHNSRSGCGISDGYDNQLFTEDGGTTFTAHHGVVGDQPQICFLDTNIGAVFSVDSRIISQQPLVLLTQGLIGLTNDGGRTWKSSYIDSIGLVTGFYQSPTMLVAAGGILDSFNAAANIRYSRGIILRSSDGGKQWSRQTLDDLYYISKLLNLDDNTYVLLGSKKEVDRIICPIYRSTDSGKTWTLVDSGKQGVSEFSRDMSFADKKVGFIVGTQGNFLWTADGGISWKHEQQDSLVHFRSVSAVSTMAYITDQNADGGSSIWKVTLPDSVTNSISEPSIEVNTAPSVWLRYPRPIPTSGKIKLDAIWVMNLDPTTITIKLYNMLGIELRDITDSFHPNAGTNTGIVDFDGSNLPTGIYYIEINGGGYRKAVPVIIAR
ncbi:MAG: hypothetical protein IPM69_07295 [Ignavibacteria bacterium]|nr:hypothetical protein [Ignavibacteria bacterium]